MSRIFTAAESARNMIASAGTAFTGRLLVGNDPYLRSGHLPDWTFIRPYSAELFDSSSSAGTWSTPADSAGRVRRRPHVIAEGLNLPPLKIIKAGVLDQDLWTLVCRNVRNAKQVDMDTHLINGVLAQAEAGIATLIDKYGADTVRYCMQEIMRAGERAARTEIAQMPDGTYCGESASDWDGSVDKPVWVRVAMTVHGDELTFDFTGSDHQATFVNSPLGNTVSIAMESFYAFIDPMAPKNQGSFAPVRVVAPEGTVVPLPATVGACGISVGEPIMEACKIALAKALPGRATGGFARHACPINFGMDLDEIDPRTHSVRQYMAETFASDGSGGAMDGFDGWPGVGPGSFLGCFVRPDIEYFEAEVPFRVTRYEFTTDGRPRKVSRWPGVFVEMVADLAGTSFHDQELRWHGGAGTRLDGRGTGAPEMWIAGADGHSRTLRTMSKGPSTGDVCKIKSPAVAV
jgi:N-methylhydantoinase B